MEGDVRESFLRLTEVESADEVLARCEADPRLLDPGFDAYLIAFEDDLRRKGEDVDHFTAWRLVLRSVREGRNLYASVDELSRARTSRAVRDLVLAEPLLLDPVIDALAVPMVRVARQQGESALADAMESRRQLLAHLRARGRDTGYFDVLVSEIAQADAAREAELRRENADLSDDFQQYAYTEGGRVTHLGDHDAMRRLMYAIAVMANAANPPLEPADATFGERVSHLAHLVFENPDPHALLDALLPARELLTEGPLLVAVAGLLDGQIDRAALDRDVVAVRRLWMTQNLLRRCSEIGVPDTFEELDQGLLWPEPNESI